MNPQQSPHQSNDWVVLFALVSGIYASVALWEYVKPLSKQFLHAYQHTLGPGMTGFLDLISPLALYALVVALIVGFLEGVLFPFVRFLFARWVFEDMKKRLANLSEGGGFFGILGVIFVVLFIIGALSKQP